MSNHPAVQELSEIIRLSLDKERVAAVSAWQDRWFVRHTVSRTVTKEQMDHATFDIRLLMEDLALRLATIVLRVEEQEIEEMTRMSAELICLRHNPRVSS